MCKMDLKDGFNLSKSIGENIKANVGSLESGSFYKDRIGPDKLGGGQ